MGKSSPSPPSPERTAQAQAEANRIDQFTPFGNLVFSGPNRNTATTTLSPGQQAILDLMESGQIGLGQRAADQIAGLPTGPIDVDQTRAAAEQAFFNRQLGLLDPVFAQQERRLEQRLADQGLPMGGEAFRESFGEFGRSRNQALEDLAAQAVLFGGQEAQRDVGIRQAGLNEIMAQLGMAQPSQPSFFGPGQIDVVGPTNMAFQAQLAQQQQQNDMLGGLLGLGGSVLGAGILSPTGFTGLFG